MTEREMLESLRAITKAYIEALSFCEFILCELQRATVNDDPVVGLTYHVISPVDEMLPRVRVMNKSIEIMKGENLEAIADAIKE